MRATAVVARENIASWAAGSPKLYQFRKGVEAMQALSETALMDERGYQWVAGVHGGFGGQPYCHHGDLNFITWHRPYVLDTELKLRAQIAAFAGQQAADEWRLPYWDWAAEDVPGLPEAFTAETYDDEGTTKPNPLLSQPYQLPYPITDFDEGEPTDATWRDPGPLSELQALRPHVLAALEEPNFVYFSRAIEGPHNSLHMWAGGFMITLRSSFDPIFWVHHCNVDRQFWQWQQGVGQPSTIPQEIREYPCRPFAFTDIRAEAFFDTRTLGYTYATSRNLVLEQDAAEAAPTVEEPAAMPFDFGLVPAGFRQSRINLHNVRHPERTVELRFFANRSSAPDASTPTTPAENFLGSHVLLGHGKCPGAQGHCDPDEDPASRFLLREKHHFTPFDVFIDVTQGLSAVVSDAPGEPPLLLNVQMIVLDRRAQQLPLSAVSFDNATLTVI